MVSNLEKERMYVEVISAACPGIQIRSARMQTHDGENNDILVVNEELIFRFPRQQDILPAFQRERVLLLKLGKHLPLPIPQPIYDSGAEDQFGKVFMGYPLLPGRPLTEAALGGQGNDAVLQTIARQLADFLTALHGLD